MEPGVNALSRVVFWTCGYVAVGIFGAPFLATPLFLFGSGLDWDTLGWILLIVLALYFLWYVP